MPSTTEFDILERIIQPNGVDLPEATARMLLDWRFVDSDRARMTELSEKASTDSLTSDERKELEAYLFMGHLLAIAHSKARRALSHRPPAPAA